MLYQHRANDDFDGYYLGNLIKTGRIEGTMEEVLGTVEQALERTINFIKQSDKIYGSQAEFYSRNFKVILEKSFTEDPETLLGRDRLDDLTIIAHGFIETH